jgi:hypothetical protein
MEKEGFSKAFLSCPLGLLEIRADDKGVVSILFSGGGKEAGDQSSPYLKKAIKQIKEYFSGKRDGFDFSMSLSGTPWQKRVWKELLKFLLARPPHIPNWLAAWEARIWPEPWPRPALRIN